MTREEGHGLTRAWKLEAVVRRPVGKPVKSEIIWNGMLPNGHVYPRYVDFIIMCNTLAGFLYCQL